MFLQDYLAKTLKRHFVKCVEWAPSSPDVNPLDYFFWDLVKTKVFQGRVIQFRIRIENENNGCLERLFNRFVLTDYKTQLKSLSLACEQLKKNRNIVSK